MTHLTAVLTMHSGEPIAAPASTAGPDFPDNQFEPLGFHSSGLVLAAISFINPGTNMSQIIVEHNPSEDKLKQLGVSSWEIWEKEVSKFPLDFTMTESAYLLEGEIHVTPQGGEKVVIKAGDFVVFPKGMKSMWEVVKPLRKHYRHS